MIDVTCPQCGTIFHSEEAHVGKQLRCNRCGRTVVIYAVEGSAPKLPILAFARKHRTDRLARYSANARRVVQSALLAIVVATAAVAFALWFHQPAMKTPSPPPMATQQTAPAQGEKSAQSVDPWQVISEEPAPAPDRHPDRTRRKLKPPDDLRPTYYNSLPTGTRIEKDLGSEGHGELSVENGTDEDAVVRLSDLSDQTVRWFFVKSHSSDHESQVPEGVYRLLFTTGLDWIESEDCFRWRPSYSEFERTFDYREERVSDGLYYHRISVTLNPVPMGNVRTRAITREVFLRGHQRVSLQRQ